MGKFIVIYGPNNLGKTTQMDLLEKSWQSIGRPYTRIKYPIYDSPTGLIINRVLRGVNGVRLEMEEEELQFLFAENRRQFEPELIRLLSIGDVFAEDYVGTGLAWGLTRDVDRGWLNECNRGLKEPDVAILLDGNRFTGGIEKEHRNEAAANSVWEKNREIHRGLALEMGWRMVDANGSVEEVHGRILEAIGESWQRI